MANITQISHPIIKPYVDEFTFLHAIPIEDALDQHLVFEKYINELILRIYGNDPNASFEDMETNTAFGIDGVAIFIADRLITSIQEAEFIFNEIKKVDVTFLFTQSKTSNKFSRQNISDFFRAIRRFFNLEHCEIPELEEFWEITKYIYSKSTKFKKSPEINMFFASLAPTGIGLSDDQHMKSAIDIGIQDLVDLNLFEQVSSPLFIGVKQIMALHAKMNSDLEISVNMPKTPIPYPKDPDGKIKNAYYGLIKLDEFIKMLTDDIDGKRVLRKGVFDNNIRYYLGSSEKVEVNNIMKEQLLGSQSFLFGMLNNGITVIGDEVRLNSEDLTLINYQIVNGCQTSHVIFEALNESQNINNKSEIHIPIRFIATEDEDTKNAIIKANNSQTLLKPEQLVALSSIQKALEQYYQTQRVKNNYDLYYERRTEQYRGENIQKTKIVTITYQIKATSALFLDLPHEVSGQYGKVEKSSRGQLFKDATDLAYLNSYYVSGLAWNKVERFVLKDDEGKKYKRARWHIVMLIKYLCCDIDKIDLQIGKNSQQQSEQIEKILLDDNKIDILLTKILELIKNCFGNNSETLSDRKLFEKKETTIKLIDFVKQYRTKETVFS